MLMRLRSLAAFFLRRFSRCLFSFPVSFKRSNCATNSLACRSSERLFAIRSVIFLDGVKQLTLC